MNVERIVWTAVPNGIAIGRGGEPRIRIALHVAPQLEATDEKLASFASFMAPWPLLATADGHRASWQFVVNIPGVDYHEPATVVTEPAPDVALWNKLFSSATKVLSRDPATVDLLADRAVLSYPAVDLVDVIENLHLTAALADPEIVPGLHQIRPVIGEEIVNAYLPQVRPRVAAAISTTPAPPPPAGTRTRAQIIDTFVHALADRRAVTREGSMNKVSWALAQHERIFRIGTDHDHRPPVIRPPSLDFHEAVAALGAHPTLLRRLGLLIDLEAPLPPSFSTAMPMQVLATSDRTTLPPLRAGMTLVSVSPVTMCRLVSGRSFVAADRPPPALGASDPDVVVDEGHLRLGDDRFVVVQPEPAAAGFAARRIGFDAAQVIADQGDAHAPIALPPMRTTGVRVVETGRALRFVAARDRLKALNDAIHGRTPAGFGLLWADDLVRGYRWDVWHDERGAWFPLTRRSGSFAIGTGGAAQTIAVPASAPDDGVVTTAVALAPAAPVAFPRLRGADEDRDLVLPETIVRWDGWSLTTPRPGKAIARDDSVPFDEQDEDLDVLLDGLPLRVHLDRAIGLPALRFGHHYRFRARAADIAGGGPSFDDGAGVGDAEHVTGLVKFTRQEPVTSPTLLLPGVVEFGQRRARHVGESAERIVVRSEGPSDTHVETSLRHVVPNAIGELLAEMHGLFDGPDGKPLASKYAQIKAREGRTLHDIPGAAADAGDHDMPYYPSGRVAPPYLPDVFARGLAVTTVSGPVGHRARTTYHVSFGDAWPDYRGTTLQVKTGGDQLEVLTSEPDGIVELALPKGAVHTVRVSAHTSLADAAQLARIDALAGFGPGRALAAAAQGTSVQATPARVVTLVHAVRQPLQPPAMFAMEATRGSFEDTQRFGRTYAMFDGVVHYHGTTTSRIDITADWSEPVDTGSNDDPDVVKPFHTNVLSLTPGRANIFVDDDPMTTVALEQSMHRHEFGDTKHRDVDYGGIATSAFTEYFIERYNTVISPTPVVVPTGGHGFVPGTVEVLARNRDRTPLTRGLQYAVDYAAGTVRATDGKSHAVEIHFVRPPTTNTTPRAARQRVNVLSSARPAAPVVDAVVPVFEWKQTDTLLGRVVTCEGATLRVLLARPWWSSGAGESLGVVLPGAPTADVLPAMVPYVTQLGFDPIFDSGSSLAQPTRTDFRLALPLGEGEHTSFTLPEAPSPVGVASHAVRWDSARNKWYADVRIATTTPYFPFVRLAVARYQRHSLPGVELSPVVLSDIVQLPPKRTVTVLRGSTGTKVTVAGPSFSNQPSFNDGHPVIRGEQPVVRAQLERRNTTIADEVLGWEPVGSALKLSPVEADDRPDGGRTFTGVVNVPSASGRYRVVVEEFQALLVDGDIALVDNAKRPAGRRLVFTATVDLPGKTPGVV